MLHAERFRVDRAQGTVHPVVDARGIGKRFNRIWAVRGVDLRLESGTLVGLAGPNGSGKSTLLRILGTSVRPSEGELHVFGRCARREPEAIRPLVGFLSQETCLYDDLSALENLKFAATMYGSSLPDEELLRLLDGVGLAEAARARVRTFSKGMAKRLSLLRATLHEPPLVLLDEPYGALDAEGSDWVDRFLGGLRAAGRTAVIATHELHRAAELFDRRIGLRAGEVEFDGPAAPSTLAPVSAGIGDAGG